MLRFASGLHFSHQYRRPALYTTRTTFQPSTAEPVAKPPKKSRAMLWAGIVAPLASAIVAGGFQVGTYMANTKQERLLTALAQVKQNYRLNTTAPAPGKEEDRHMAIYNRKAFANALAEAVRTTHPLLSEMRDLKRLNPHLLNLELLSKRLDRLSDSDIEFTEETRKLALYANSPEKFGEILFDWVRAVSPEVFQSADQVEALDAYSKELYQAFDHIRDQKLRYGVGRDYSLLGLAGALMLSALVFLEQRKKPA